MSRDIKFLSLQKNELAYEVEIRGEVPASKTEDLRKQISKLCRIFPSEDILESPFDPADEANAVEVSLTKLKQNYNALQTKFDKNLFGRSKALCNHLYHRLNRIDCSSTPEVLSKVNLLLDKFCLLEPYFQQESPTTSTEQTDTEVTSVPAASQVVVTCTKNFGELATLKYDGKTCARTFIQRVDEFTKARGIPAAKILSFATEIFTNDALHWFRAVQDQVTSWAELCDRLKEDFSLADFDYRFLAEIRARTQGERENITIYFSVMAGMFSQLRNQLSEMEKLEILLHNIRPCYASVLSSVTEINSIESLRTLCRNYENVQTRLAQFQEPPRPSSNTLAPEFAYVQHSGPSDTSRQNLQQSPKDAYRGTYNNSSNRNSFSVPNKMNADAGYRNPPRPLHSVQVKRKFCPRCRVDTHGLRNCTVERKILCFRCGKPDVRFYDCPDCQGVSASTPKN